MYHTSLKQLMSTELVLLTTEVLQASYLLAILTGQPAVVLHLSVLRSAQCVHRCWGAAPSASPGAAALLPLEVAGALLPLLQPPTGSTPRQTLHTPAVGIRGTIRTPTLAILGQEHLLLMTPMLHTQPMRHSNSRGHSRLGLLTCPPTIR